MKEILVVGVVCVAPSFFFCLNDPEPTEIYTLSLHDALPISGARPASKSSVTWLRASCSCCATRLPALLSFRLCARRSEEHTSELQSQSNLVCRLLLEKKKKNNNETNHEPSTAELPYLSYYTS